MAVPGAIVLGLAPPSSACRKAPTRSAAAVGTTARAARASNPAWLSASLGGAFRGWFVLAGELFNRIVDQGPFSEADAAALFAQILLSMDYLHSLSIVHRDVKPENSARHRTRARAARAR